MERATFKGSFKVWKGKLMKHATPKLQERKAQNSFPMKLLLSPNQLKTKQKRRRFAIDFETEKTEEEKTYDDG